MFLQIFQIIDERHNELGKELETQRANLEEEKQQLDEDRKEEETKS
jgi:hypothetical protein